MLEDDLRHLNDVIENGGTAYEIDAALIPIAVSGDPALIRPLLLMLNDISDDNGMWSLVHAAEQFDNGIYVDHFLSALGDLNATSRRWASILLMRVLNSDGGRVEIVRHLRVAPDEVRCVARSLCESINERDPRFLSKTVPVLIAAS